MAKRKQAKPRNYAATETTLINLRALKKRLTQNERRLKWLEERNMGFGSRIQRLEERMRDLDGKRQ